VKNSFFFQKKILWGEKNIHSSQNSLVAHNNNDIMSDTKHALKNNIQPQLAVATICDAPTQECGLEKTGRLKPTILQPGYVSRCFGSRSFFICTGTNNPMFYFCFIKRSFGCFPRASHLVLKTEPGF
jgi:hypothetical protein